MNKTLNALLGVLPVVGPIIAAAPEFRRLYDQVAGSSGPKDKATAKEAYDLAISEAKGAHERLQELVKSHGG